MTNPSTQPIPPFEMSPLIAVGDTGGVMLNGSLLTCVTHDTEKNESTLEFTLNLEDPKVKSLFTEMKLTFRGRTYYIRTIDFEGSTRSGNSTVKVYAERSWYDLLYSGKLGGLDWELADVATCLRTILADTKWSVGSIDRTLPATWKMSDGTALAQVNQVGETYGLQPVFDEDAKKVHLLQNPGRDRGTTFTYYKDVTKASRRIDTTGLITRIYGQSKDGVTISSVNGGLPYLEDYSYSTDLRIAYYDFKEGISPSSMKRLMEAYLFMRAKPVISYEFELSGLGNRTDEIERFDIFDTVFIMDEDYASSVRSRVVGLTIDWINQYKSKVELGNSLASLARVADQGNGNAPGRISTDSVPPSNVPATPAPPSISSEGYWDGDYPARMLKVQWKPVTTALDGRGLTVDSYEVSLSTGAVISTTDLQATFEGLPAGKETLVKVRAVAKGVSGFWSEPIVAAADAPTIIPPVPSGLTASPKDMLVSITWDGTVFEGDKTVPAPDRVSHLEVEQATSADGPWSAAGVIHKKDDPLVLAYDKNMAGTTMYYRFRCIDHLGAAGPSRWSTPVSAQIRNPWAEDLQKELDQTAADVAKAKEDVQEALEKVNSQVDTSKYDKAIAENTEKLNNLSSTLSKAQKDLDAAKKSVASINTDLDNQSKDLKALALESGMMEPGNLVWNPRAKNNMAGWTINSPLSAEYSGTGGPENTKHEKLPEFVQVSWAGKPVDKSVDFGSPDSTHMFPVSPGQEFYASIWVRSSVALPAGALCMDIYGGNVLDSPKIDANKWVKFEGTIKIDPKSGSKRSWFRFKFTSSVPQSAKVDISGPTVIEMAGDLLIVDGAVSARKVAANAIEAGHITSGAVTAGKIAADAVTSDQIAANAVTAKKIAADAVTSDKIAANAVTANAIDANAVTAGKIDANAITSREVAAKSIMTSHLTIAPGNLFPDPYFQDPSWGTSGDVYADKDKDGGTLILNGVGKQRGSYLQPESSRDSSMILEADSTYRLTATVHRDTESFDQISVYIRYRNTSGSRRTNRVGVIDLSGAKPSTWSKVSAELKTPSDMKDGTCTMGFFVESAVNSGTAFMQAVSVVRAADASLIVDGAVVADKIASGAVTTDHMKANSISGDRIKADTIVGDKIKGDSITGNHIKSGSITSKEIQAGSIKATNIEAATFTQVATNILPLIPGTTDPAWTAQFTPGSKEDIGGVKRQVYRSSETLVSPSYGNMVAVDPDIEYDFSIWVSSTSPAPNFYIELRDQDNSHAVESGGLNDNGYTESPDANGVARQTGTNYLVQGMTAPTSWTKYTTRISLKPGVRFVKIGTVYPVHPGGRKGGMLMIADMQLRPHIIKQKEVDELQNKLIQANTKNIDNIRYVAPKLILMDAYSRSLKVGNDFVLVLGGIHNGSPHTRLIVKTDKYDWTGWIEANLTRHSSSGKDRTEMYYVKNGLMYMSYSVDSSGNINPHDTGTREKVLDKWEYIVFRIYPQL